MLDALVLADRSAEDDAFGGVGGGLAQRSEAEADGFGGDQDALGVHAVQDVLEAAAFLADAVFHRNLQPVDEQLVGAASEYTIAIFRITVEKAEINGLLTVAAEGVQRLVAAQINADVGEEVDDLRIGQTLVLGIDAYRLVAVIDQCLSVTALNAAVTALLVGHVHAEAGKAGFAQRQAQVGGQVVQLTVIGLAVHAGLGFDGQAFTVLFEHEVDHARDRVRAVLCGRAVTQNFDLTQGNRRKLGDVREVGPLATKLHRCRAVTALAVHKHQRVVSRQAAQSSGAYQAVGVVDVLGVYVEGWHQVAQQIVDIGRTLILEVCR